MKLITLLLSTLTATSLFVIPAHAGSYVSGSVGNGGIYGDGAVDDRGMRWKSFDVRFGKEVDPSSVFPDEMFPDDGILRIDVFHYNEGHPTNNHRDGFGMQIVLRKPVGDIMHVEVALGPYYSSNTTTMNGMEYDDSRLGMMVTTALLTNMEQLVPGLKMRFALNHVIMPGAHSSNGVLIGISKDFGPYTPPSESRNPIWTSVFAGVTKTNHGGTNSAINSGLEVKRYSDNGMWAGSAQWISEGDDDSLIDRKGMSFQGWFVQPLNDKWAASFGLGPYIGRDRRHNGRTEVNALITLQLERSIGKNWKVYANFNRITSFNRKTNNDRINGTDRDMGRIGVSRRW